MNIGDLIRVTDAAGALYVGATGRVMGWSPHGVMLFVDWDDDAIPRDTPLLVGAGDTAEVALPASAAFAMRLDADGLEVRVASDSEVVVYLGLDDMILFTLEDGVWTARLPGGVILTVPHAEGLAQALRVLGTVADGE